MQEANGRIGAMSGGHYEARAVPIVPRGSSNVLGISSRGQLSSYNGTGVARRHFMRVEARLLVCSSLLVCLLGVTACDENSPVGPTVPLSQRFVLAPSESVIVEGQSLRVQFLRVSGDSRCPADALCIQGGDAIVHVRASGSVTADYELHTGGPPQSIATPTGLRIELTELQPYPFSSRTISPGDYRATLVVTR